MARRVLVPQTGSGPSNNLIRGLHAADASLVVVGYHWDPFLLKQSLADRNYIVPSHENSGFEARLLRLVESEHIDLLIPTRDWEVEWFSELRGVLGSRVFLPSASAIRLAQDKYDLTVFLRARGLPVPETVAVKNLDAIPELFEHFPGASMLWCRSRLGTDSRGATKVKTAEQARSWIHYWEVMRGLPAESFTLAEYLPGRDFACQSVWKDGTMILAKTYERLEYVGGVSRPSGVSSRPSLAKLVREPVVVEISAAAVRAIDPAASGAFDVDLKESQAGVPCITEINAGRFLSSQPIFDLGGHHNMTAVFLRLAFGEPVAIDELCDADSEWYMVRDVDLLPLVFNARDLWDGLLEIEP
jgi:glutathione synthase/RimK-type ligase-like ATP-grasp enzyme